MVGGGGNFARGNAGTFAGGTAARQGTFGREGPFDRGREFGRDRDRFDRDRGFRTFAFGFPDYSYDYGYYDDGCYQLRRVPTPFGWRWRRVWVCDY
jgi:hypothetical protein